MQAAPVVTEQPSDLWESWAQVEDFGRFAVAFRGVLLHLR